MTLSDNSFIVIGVGCLLIVIFIAFVPIIAVNVSQPNSLAVCITQPCVDMVVVQDKKTILEFLSDEENVELLTRLNPDASPDEVGMCILQYEPVCGTDGVTYGNECQLNLSENVDIAFIGEC